MLPPCSRLWVQGTPAAHCLHILPISILSWALCTPLLCLQVCSYVYEEGEYGW